MGEHEHDEAVNVDELKWWIISETTLFQLGWYER